jgi:hypothetical protein
MSRRERCEHCGYKPLNEWAIIWRAVGGAIAGYSIGQFIFTLPLFWAALTGAGLFLAILVTVLLDRRRLAKSERELEALRVASFEVLKDLKARARL